MSKDVEGYSLLSVDWDNLSYDEDVQKELVEVMKVAWQFQYIHSYPVYRSETKDIIKCTYRLVHLFLSDDYNDDIYSFGDVDDRGMLVISALKISKTILRQNEDEVPRIDEGKLWEAPGYYHWLKYINTEEFKSKLMTYDFRLLRYPYHRCFSYLSYDNPTPWERYRNELKALFISQVGYYKPALDAIDKAYKLRKPTSRHGIYPESIKEKFQKQYASHIDNPENPYDFPDLIPLGGDLGDRRVSTYVQSPQRTPSPIKISPVSPRRKLSKSPVSPRRKLFPDDYIQ